jgi:hypothetical protein
LIKNYPEAREKRLQKNFKIFISENQTTVINAKLYYEADLTRAMAEKILSYCATRSFIVRARIAPDSSDAPYVSV